MTIKTTVLITLVLVSSLSGQEKGSHAKVQATTRPVWKMMDIDSKASLRGLHVVNDSVVWASGSDGTIIHTLDGGKTWDVQVVAGAEELDFRDIQALSEKTVVAITSGTPARIYRSGDGGSSWKIVFEEKDEKFFLDALSFFDRQNGMVMGDPIDGNVFLLSTNDEGRTWKRSANPAAVQTGEAGFAASGTNMITVGDQTVMIALGGAEADQTKPSSRVVVSNDRGDTWDFGKVPMARSPSAGIFSICFSGVDNGIAVGGDYLDQDSVDSNFAVTRDGGKTWSVPEGGKGPSGYRSCVAVGGNKGKVFFVAVGPNGTDVSTDLGDHWRSVSETGFHAVQFTNAGNLGWASGSQGRIAKWIGQ